MRRTRTCIVMHICAKPWSYIERFTKLEKGYTRAPSVYLACKETVRIITGMDRNFFASVRHSTCTIRGPCLSSLGWQVTPEHRPKLYRPQRPTRGQSCKEHANNVYWMRLIRTNEKNIEKGAQRSINYNKTVTPQNISPRCISRKRHQEKMPEFRLQETENPCTCDKKKELGPDRIAIGDWKF